MQTNRVQQDLPEVIALPVRILYIFLFPGVSDALNGVVALTIDGYFFFSNCDVWRLNFRPFDGWLLLSRNLIQEFKWALISVLININCCVLEVDLAFHF